MKKRLSYLAAAVITVIVSFACCLIWNGRTGYLANGSAVPEDIAQNSYVITGLQTEEESQLTTVILTGIRQEEQLALLINDMGSFVLSLEVYMNGHEIYSYQEDSLFRRTNIITLDPRYLSGDGTAVLTFSTFGWQSRSQEILSGRLNAAPKLILCTAEHAQHIAQNAYGVMNLLIGMYLVIIASSISMYMKRTKEYGYLFLTVLCLIRFLNTAIDSSMIFPITMRQYYELRHVLVVLPVVFHVSVGIWLLKPDRSQNHRRHLLYTVCLTAAATVLQEISGHNWYHLLQLAAFLTFSVCCERAAVRGVRGWQILCIGYTAGYAVVAFIYLVNIWGLVRPGLLLICTNFTNFSYIPGLFACMMFISRQLVSKFNETEALTEELSETNRELDRRVERKTAELVAAQNARQNIMLNIFHDLRNPVFVLKGCLDNIRPSDPEQENFVQIMKTRLELLQKLIDDLFLSEKLEAGAITLYPDDVELEDLIREIADGLSATGGKKIVTHLSPAMVWADETRLMQVFQNLAENARIYTPEGGTITLSVGQEGGWATVRIADTGAGMTEEECSHIFERYYTGSRAKKNVSSGLGLSIAWQLVTLHGGTIEVKSRPGEGTEFIVKLPPVGGQREEGEKQDDPCAVSRG